MAEDPEAAEDDPSVLTPEELQIEDEQEDAIKKIGENRYVISPNEDGDASTRRTPEVLSTDDAALPDEADGDAARASTGEAGGTGDGVDSAPGPAETDGASAADRTDGPDVELEARTVALEHASGQYGIDAVVQTDDGIAERRITADDEVAVFEEFLRWYARRLDRDSPPAATISALLAEADLSD